MQARVSPLDTIEQLPPGGVVRLGDVMKTLGLTRKQIYALIRALDVQMIRFPGVREIRLKMPDAKLMEKHLAGELIAPQAPRAPIKRRQRGH